MTEEIRVKGGTMSQGGCLKTMDEPSWDARCRGLDLDSALHFLGRFGKYQMTQLLLLLFIAMTIASSIVNGIFTGKATGFTCTKDNRTLTMSTNQSVQPSPCYVDSLTNVTSQDKCTQYDYDGGETTLSFVAEWDLVCDREALARLPQILTMVGMLVGATSLPHLGDRFGRRKLLIGACVCQAAVSLLLAFVGQFELFVFLKLLSGACQQGVMVTLYSLELEVMPLELRPLVSLFQSSVWTTSVCLVGVLGYCLRDFSWRDLQLAYGVAFLPGLLCLWFIDESPRWLVVNNKSRDVETVLRKACRMNNKDYDKLMTACIISRKDLEPLVVNGDDSDAGLEKDEEREVVEESFSFKSLVVNASMRKITFVMCYTWMICALTYYGLTLMSTSLAGNPFVNFFLLVVAEFPSGVYTYYTMRTIGRKKTIMYSNAVAGLALLLAGVVANTAPSSPVVKAILTGLPLVGKLAISGSFGTVWTYTPELYPTNLRNYGLGIASTAARLGATFSPLFTLLVRKVPWAPGTLFACGCFLSVFLMSFMPETRQRGLPRSIKDVDKWFQQDAHQPRAQTDRKLHTQNVTSSSKS